eukprot:293960-Alexandrium_andersonii.AAC.1
MSASLVGSEMCIRDSVRGAHARQALQETAGARVRLSRTAFMSRNTRRAVSYTHLTLPTICSV